MHGPSDSQLIYNPVPCTWIQQFDSLEKCLFSTSVEKVPSQSSLQYGASCKHQSIKCMQHDKISHLINAPAFLLFHALRLAGDRWIASYCTTVYAWVVIEPPGKIVRPRAIAKFENEVLHESYFCEFISMHSCSWILIGIELSLVYQYNACIRPGKLCYNNVRVLVWGWHAI